MKITLQNDKLLITVDEMGAELTRIYQKEYGLDYLCPRIKPEWKEQAPLLFPFMGNLKDGYYVYKGKTYKCGTHGFGRFRKFDVEQRCESSVVLVLQEEKETLEQYPFCFQLKIQYRLEGNKILIIADIFNNGTEELITAIGFHPGFRCPIAQGSSEDYELYFEQKFSASRAIMNGGFIQSIQPKYYEDICKLPITKSLFQDGVITLTDMTSKQIVLKNSVDERKVELDFEDYPECAIWAPANETVDYICIEPRHGLQDFFDTDHILEKKSGMLHINPGESVKKVFSITIY